MVQYLLLGKWHRAGILQHPRVRVPGCCEVTAALLNSRIPQQPDGKVPTFTALARSLRGNDRLLQSVFSE
jgi:hypothetical protein